ncbi:hypothetical protein GCM10008944_30920 [Cytobacillus oceanisediminis]
MTEPETDRPAEPVPSVEAEDRTVGDLRRSALAQDALLFCVAFTAGASVVLLARLLGGAADPDLWTVGRSDDLLLGGLVAGELFLVWNNGWRQGVRGHSIGKHREGLLVVRPGTARPTGAPRGLLRGLTAALLLDLAVAAIPIGLPTVLRRFTPEAWHVGAAAYVAVLLLLVPLLVGLRRGVLDRVAGTEVVRAVGADAVTSDPRRRALVVLDLVGLAGVLAVCAAHLSFVWPLIWRWPGLL